MLRNTYTAIIDQICTIISGFILPNLFINNYGSDTNGLVSSITQFLAFFSLMEMGVGIVVKAALYKPLANEDNNGISRVIIASKKFFNKIGMGMIVYSVLIMFYFAFGVGHNLSIVSTFILVGAIALSSITQYMFGISYQLLLFSDQKNYIQLWINVLVTVLNLGISIILIKLKFGIEIVKLVSAVVILLRPLLLKLYVDKHYNLNLKIKLEEDPLKQKTSAFAQHCSQYISKNTDIIILTIFSSLENVSIYGVYHLVTNGLQQFIQTITGGINSLLGNMYAKNEVEKLNKTFTTFEWMLHTVVTLLYAIACVMVIPFVEIYTQEVTDANYIVPTFAFLLVISNASYCLRMPYNIMVNVAGHFKQTQLSTIIEAALNVAISILLVRCFGLIGVAIGTLVSMTYRTIYLSWYLKNHILNRSFSSFVKLVAIDILSFFAVIFMTKRISITEVTWMAWFFMAIKVSLEASVIVFLINYIAYGEILKNAFILLFVREGRNE